MTAEGLGKHLISVRRFVVEWGQCDPAGIVFHPRYLEVFDACAAQLFAEASGMSKAEMLRRYGAAGIPVVEAGAKFHHPCRYGDPARVDTWIAKLGRSSFRLCHRLRSHGRLAVEGWSTRVWVARDPEDPEQFQSRPIPADLVSVLRGEVRPACPMPGPETAEGTVLTSGVER